MVSYYHTAFDNGRYSKCQTTIQEFLFSDRRLFNIPESHKRYAVSCCLKRHQGVVSENILNTFINMHLKEQAFIISQITDKPTVTALKTLMPGVTVSAYFPELRDQKASYKHSGFIAIDCDNVCPEKAISLLNQSEQNSVLAIKKSVSGKGFFVVIKIQDPEKHKEHYLSAMQEFKNLYGSEYIDHTQDIARLRFWSYDQAMYYNPNPIEYTKIYKQPEYKSVELKKLEPTTKYDDPLYMEKIIDWTLKNSNTNIDGSVHTFVFAASSTCAQYGISEDYAIGYLWEKFQNHPRVKGHSRDYEYFADKRQNGYKHNHSQHNTKNFR